MMDITTADAAARYLPGHDSFRYDASIYYDDLQRDWAVVYLCREALKAFTNTIIIGHLPAWNTERKAVSQWNKSNNQLPFEQMPDMPYLDAYIDRLNLEHLMIAAGFELVLKGIMLEQNYIMHNIVNRGGYKVLASEQKTRPISKDELFLIDEFRFDGGTNYLPGIAKTSINFSILVKEPAYVSKLGLDSQTIGLIEEFRDLRNQIHFPGEALSTPARAAYPKPIETFLADFIDKFVVRHCNELIDRHTLNWQKLSPVMR